MLVEKIRNAQNGNEIYMLEMIEQFNPLLRKYAYHLNYEDAINDMTVKFIVLLRGMNLSIFEGKGDGAIVNYIVRSMEHAYIKLSEHHTRLKAGEVLIGDLGETQQYYMSTLKAPMDDNLSIFKLLLSSASLTKNEEDVIIKEFYFGLSSAEIAQETRVSRQSVNQVKNRALQKLRATIDI